MPTIPTLNSDEQIVFQCYATSWLLMDLENNQFLQSEYYRDMTFAVPAVKSMLSTVGITNQGCTLMILYALLVIPKEKFFEDHPAEIAALNAFVASNSRNTKSTYKSDSQAIDFIYHIRNAVAHARISFPSPEVIAFKDRKGKNRDGKVQEFYSELTLPNFRDFVARLQTVHIARANAREKSICREKQEQTASSNH